MRPTACLTPQLTLALQYIHERHSLIHRDLKTQNVFLMSDGQTLKLGDFGVSRVLDSPTDLARTCVGTPFYMCPELMRKQRYSNKADIWALGCVLYELATLTHAFDARDMQARCPVTPCAPLHSPHVSGAARGFASRRCPVAALARLSCRVRHSSAPHLCATPLRHTSAPHLCATPLRWSCHSRMSRSSRPYTQAPISEMPWRLRDALEIAPSTHQ